MQLFYFYCELWRPKSCSFLADFESIFQSWCKYSQIFFSTEKNKLTEIYITVNEFTTFDNVEIVRRKSRCWVVNEGLKPIHDLDSMFFPSLAQVSHVCTLGWISISHKSTAILRKTTISHCFDLFVTEISNSFFSIKFSKSLIMISFKMKFYVEKFVM